MLCSKLKALWDMGYHCLTSSTRVVDLYCTVQVCGYNLRGIKGRSIIVPHADWCSTQTWVSARAWTLVRGSFWAWAQVCGSPWIQTYRQPLDSRSVQNDKTTIGLQKTSYVVLFLLYSTSTFTWLDFLENDNTSCYRQCFFVRIPEGTRVQLCVILKRIITETYNSYFERVVNKWM